MLKLEVSLVSATERQHEGKIAGLACVGNRVFTAGQDKRILSFELQGSSINFTGPELRDAREFLDLQAVPRSGSGITLVAACHDHDLRVWSLGAHKEVPSTLLLGHEAEVTGVDAMDNFALSSSCDHTARVWDLQREAEIVALKHPAGVHRALFCPVSRTIMTSCADGTLRSWDCRASNNRPTCFMAGSVAETGEALATTEGDLVAWPISNSEVQVFDVPRCGARGIASFQLSSPVRSLQFLPQARLSCGDTSGKLLIMKLQDLSMQQLDLQPVKIEDRQAITRLRCSPAEGGALLTFLFSRHGWGYGLLS